MKNIFEKLLILLAQLYLKKYRPLVVGVTGNVGKTSTRDAISAVLSVKGTVKVGVGSINNLMGVPLTIIGTESELREYISQGGGSHLFWVKVLIFGFLRLFTSIEYPKTIVLEYGADKPGDIKELARLFPPDIAVVTGIGEIPVHVEFFASPKALAEEKSNLLKVLTKRGHAILNFDDLTVLEMRGDTVAQVTTFGFGDGADMQIQDFDILTTPVLSGISFKLKTRDNSQSVQISGVLGRPQALACAAAVAVAQVLDIGLSDAVRGLASYMPPPGRMRVLRGIKNSTIIDDSYNASPLATHSALDTLKSVSVGARKVAVLGDMLELGEYSEMAHRAVGDQAGDVSDVLVCVGDKAKFIADSASNQMPSAHIFTFHTSDEAKTKVQELLQEGDLVLIKGSQGKRMEKIVEEVMAEPERRGELLVRQSQKWLAK